MTLSEVTEEVMCDYLFLPQSHDIQESIPLVNQLVAKYKARISPFLQEVFMPVVQTIITCLNQPFDPADLEVREETD